MYTFSCLNTLHILQKLKTLRPNACQNETLLSYFSGVKDWKLIMIMSIFYLT